MGTKTIKYLTETQIMNMYYEGGKAHHNFFHPTTNNVTIHLYFVPRFTFFVKVLYIILFEF